MRVSRLILLSNKFTRIRGFNSADHILALTEGYQLDLGGAGTVTFCSIRHYCRKCVGQSHPRP